MSWSSAPIKTVMTAAVEATDPTPMFRVATLTSWITEWPR